MENIYIVNVGISPRRYRNDGNGTPICRIIIYSFCGDDSGMVSLVAQ